MPGLVAVCLSDGSLVAVELDNTQFTINSLPASTGAQYVPNKHLEKEFNPFFLSKAYFSHTLEPFLGVLKENSWLWPGRAS